MHPFFFPFIGLGRASFRDFQGRTAHSAGTCQPIPATPSLHDRFYLERGDLLAVGCIRGRTTQTPPLPACPFCPLPPGAYFALGQKPDFLSISAMLCLDISSGAPLLLQCRTDPVSLAFSLPGSVTSSLGTVCLTICPLSTLEDLFRSRHLRP